MVEPSSRAETVTPRSFSPAAEAMVPRNSWSAACALVIAAEQATAALANRMLRTLVIIFLPRGMHSASGWCGHCPHIRNDRVDLAIVQVVLEGGHPRRAAEDVLAHDRVIAVGCGLVERRTVGPGVERRRQMAHAA